MYFMYVYYMFPFPLFTGLVDVIIMIFIACLNLFVSWTALLLNSDCCVIFVLKTQVTLKNHR